MYETTKIQSIIACIVVHDIRIGMALCFDKADCERGLENGQVHLHCYNATKDEFGPDLIISRHHYQNRLVYCRLHSEPAIWQECDQAGNIFCPELTEAYRKELAAMALDNDGQMEMEIDFIAPKPLLLPEELEIPKELESILAPVQRLAVATSLIMLALEEVIPKDEVTVLSLPQLFNLLESRRHRIMDQLKTPFDPESKAYKELKCTPGIENRSAPGA